MSRIYFGSLEHAADEISAEQSAPGQLNFSSTSISNETTTTIQFSEAQSEILAELDRKRKAKTIAIPTDDSKVVQVLREIKEPITLFAEGPYERRERLRQILSIRSDIPAKLIMRIGASSMAVESDEDEDEEFFIPGTQELEDCRRWIASYSIPRASRRLHQQKIESQAPITQQRESRKQLYRSLQTSELYATQVGSERPLSSCAFSPDSSMLVTGCLGGSVSLWSIPSCEPIIKFKGHAERVGGISWHPAPLSENSVNFASGGGDGSVYLWNLVDEEPVMKLEGHPLRVASCAFHPSGRFLGTASYDMSWRFWDVNTGQEILLQEGHSREVYSIKFQWDGSLAATGGLDCHGRIWDLRVGRSLMLLSGHIQPIHSIDWNPNSYQLLTASADHTIRLHDIRNLKSNLHVVPAHGNLVSSVKYRHQFKDRNQNAMMEDDNPSNCGSPDLKFYYGDYFVSASFDKTVRIWGSGDFKCISTLSGHENRIMDMDLSNDSKFIASASYDRTFKIWTNEII